MNRKLTGLLIAITVSVAMGNAAIAQPANQPPGMKIMTFEQGAVHMLNELGAVIVLEDSSLTVQMVMPAQDRSAEYLDVDLQEKDQILMLNGKKIISIQDLDEGYKRIDIGQDVQLAIKRGKDRMIVSFPKADPKKLTNKRTLILRSQDDLPINQSEDVKHGTQIITLDNTTGEIYPVLGAGVILVEDDKNVKIKTLLPNAAELYGDVAVVEGDIIKSLQKKDISSAAQFSDNFKQIPVGDDVDLLILRDNKLIEVSFDKKEPPAVINKSGGN